jgi:plasmid replication initiation protein
MKDTEARPPAAGTAGEGASGALAEALRSLPAAERRLVLLAYALIDGEARREREIPLKDLAGFLPAAREKNGARLEEACRKLLKRSLALPSEGGGRTLLPWFSSIRLLPGGEALGFGLQPAVDEGLRGLRGRDEALSLEALARLDGKYSRDLLEALLAARPEGSRPRDWKLETSLEGIRAMLGLDDRYEKAKALRKWVVDDAVSEINLAGLGLRVEVETVLLGKKTKGFLFKVRQRKAK